LEVRLGQARLERDNEQVIEIEAQLAKVHAEATPRIIPEISYPSPMQEAAFYGLPGEIVWAIDPHTEASTAALLLNNIIFFGNSIGNRPHIKVGADKHTAKLFGAFVGKSAKARKGSSVSPIRELFKEVDAVWATTKIQGGVSSGEGLIEAVHDEVKKSLPIKEKGRVVGYEEVIIDEGVKDKRLLIIEEELARVLKVMSRDGNILSPVIRQVFDSPNIQVITKNSPARATGTHISIIFHITLEELFRYLNNTEFSNGFCNRIIWVCVDRSKLLPFGGNFQISTLSSVLNRLREAHEFAKNVDEVTWADETRPYWESIYPELSAAKPGIIGALLARSETQVIRLALIYTLMDCKKQIEICHLKAALAVWGYAEDSVRYIFKNVIGDSVAEKIMGALTDNPQGLTRTQISHALGRHYNSLIGETELPLRALADLPTKAPKSFAVCLSAPTLI